MYEKIFHKLVNSYRNLLTKVLRQRWFIIGILLVLMVLGFIVYRSFAGELSPPEDIGVIMTNMDAPTNASFAYSDFYRMLHLFP